MRPNTRDMMNKIKQLTTEINELEDQAGQVDPTDHTTLYELLCKAYFNAKDIIELQKGINPPVEVPTANDNTSQIEELELEVKSLTAQLRKTKQEAEKTCQELAAESSINEVALDSIRRIALGEVVDTWDTD